MQEILVTFLFLLLIMPISASAETENGTFTYDGKLLIYDEIEQGVWKADFT